jgi:hypothetical protein
LAVHSLPQFKRNSDRDSWLIAWALTLALYAAAILIFRSLPPPTPPPVVRRFEPVRLVFKSPGPAERKADARKSEPQMFTELPSDRADAAPKQADFLSNVTSRARDRVPGGDAALPRMQGEGDFPAVKLEPDGGSSGSPAAPSTPRPAESAAARAAESPKPTSTEAQGQTSATGSKSASPTATKPDSARPAAAENPQGATGAGRSDSYYQPEMDNPQGNASLTGDVSLNTMAWDYAPWLERFGRKLMQRWFPPPAYSLGILKEGGWTIVEAEISRSGQLLRIERLEQRGHPSLAVAAESAVRSMAPFEALPANFPEPTLTLRIRMIYPKLHPR